MSIGIPVVLATGRAIASRLYAGVSGRAILFGATVHGIHEHIIRDVFPPPITSDSLWLGGEHAVGCLVESRSTLLVHGGPLS